MSMSLLLKPYSGGKGEEGGGWVKDWEFDF